MGRTCGDQGIHFLPREITQASRRFLQELEGNHWPAPDDLANVVRSGIFAVLVQNPQLEERWWYAHRVWFNGVINLVEDGGKALDQTIQFVKDPRQAAIQFVFVLAVQRRSRRAEHLQ